MTDAGCPPDPATIAAGPVTFEIANRDSGRSSEVELVQGDRIIGEKEHLTPGLSGTLALDLAAGSYEVYCPGALTERSPFTVTAASAAASGSAASSPPTAAGLSAALQTATVGYAVYVRQEVAALVEATARFSAAVEAGDVEGAKALYPQRGSTTSGSSRSRRASATWTRRSTSGSPMSRIRRRGPASTAWRRRSGSTARRPAWPPSRGSSSPTSTG